MTHTIQQQGGALTMTKRGHERNKQSPIHWTQEQDLVLRLLWGLVSNERLGLLIGRTPDACYQRAMVLGLNKWENRRLAREGSG